MAPDSPALEQEREALSGAEDLDTTYQDLTFQVVDAQVLATGGDRVVLGLRVERSGYAEHSPACVVRHDAQTDDVEVELRRGADGWRIWGWT